MSPFFITGLPRSRTAWMAAFLTDGHVFCHHELLKDCISKQQFYDEMSKPSVGNSDSGLVFTDFQERFPESKTVIIERNRKDVFDSLSDIYDIDVNAFNDLAERIDQIQGLRVPFELLDQEMETVCEYIGIPYNKQRHDMFKVLNIQTTDLLPRVEALMVWAGE